MCPFLFLTAPVFQTDHSPVFRARSESSVISGHNDSVEVQQQARLRRLPPSPVLYFPGDRRSRRIRIYLNKTEKTRRESLEG